MIDLFGRLVSSTPGVVGVRDPASGYTALHWAAKWGNQEVRRGGQVGSPAGGEACGRKGRPFSRHKVNILLKSSNRSVLNYCTAATF